jgi:hypothetical protein
MRSISGLGIGIAALAIAASQQAAANTIAVDCMAAATTALGTALATVSPGDTLEISGVCQQDVTITTPGLTLEQKSGDGTDVDGVQGQVEIAGAQQVTISGLLLGISEGAFTFSSGSDQALLYAHDGASVVLVTAAVQNSPLLGILAVRASVSLLNSSVAGSGGLFTASTSEAPQGFGIRATEGSTINLVPASVSSNNGGGVALVNDSTLAAQNGFILSNGGQQILLQGGSTVHATNVGVDGSTCPGTHSFCGNAIEAAGASTVRLDGQDEALFVFTVENQSAIVLGQGSALLASGVFVLQTGTVPAIQASDNSTIALAGGNLLCSGSCDNATSGTVIQIDHVSTLIDVAAQDFGYSPAQDMIFGGAVVQLQSTVDLGIGTIASAPGVLWTTGSGGIVAKQNSSFRLQGGTTITGEVSLSQGSNGIFNAANGGTNVVSGGVSCPFAAIPGAHVAAANANVLSPTPILAVNFFSATANQCLPF